MGEVRLVVAAQFFNQDTEEIEGVNRFIMKPVDSGASAIANIQQGSGRLSKAARRKVQILLEENLGLAVRQTAKVRGRREQTSPCVRARLENIELLPSALPSGHFLVAQGEWPPKKL